MPLRSTGNLMHLFWYWTNTGSKVYFERSEKTSRCASLEINGLLNQLQKLLPGLSLFFFCCLRCCPAIVLSYRFRTRKNQSKVAKSFQSSIFFCDTDFHFHEKLFIVIFSEKENTVHQNCVHMHFAVCATATLCQREREQTKST